MGFFDRFTNKQETNYFDPDEVSKAYQSNLNKSFRVGQSDQRIDDLGITVGVDDNRNNEKQSKIDHDYFLRKKQQLQQYAEDALVQSIIRTRTNQVLRYATPKYLSADGDGFVVTKKGKPRSSLTKEEEKRAKELENYIYNTGSVDYDWRDKFPQFLAKIIYDYYVYDQINIERIFETKTSDKLNHFNHVDAGTILIDKYPKSIDKPKSYVQYVDQKEQSHFDQKSLVFKTYWNQSKQRMGGYGFSPVEASIPQLNYRVNAEQFNARFFSQGGLTRGILLINPGDGAPTSRSQLETIRRNLMPAQGINGSWKIPLLLGNDAKFVNMTQNSKDMEYTQFLGYLTNEITAIFGIQPEEVNINNRGGANGQGKGSSTLNEGNTTKTKIDASRASGLIPLIKNIERLITDNILKYVDDDYQFLFTPSDEQQEIRDLEILKAKEEIGMTVNEARQALGLPAIEDGDVPGTANNLIQYWNILGKMDPETNKLIQQQTSYDPDKGTSGAEMQADSKDTSKDEFQASNEGLKLEVKKPIE